VQYFFFESRHYRYGTGLIPVKLNRNKNTRVLYVALVSHDIVKQMLNVACYRTGERKKSAKKRKVVV
jgi:hypothetical protein